MRIKIIVFTLIACLVLIISSCGSDTTADGSQTKPAEGEVQEGGTAVAPLNESDFIFKYDDETQTMDAIEFLNNATTYMLLLRYNPQVDESKEGVITTARGIRLGDTREDVENVYGKDYVFHKELERDFLRASPYIPWENAVSHIHYFSDSKAGLTFCFDDNNEVSFIIFTRPLIAGELE